MATKKLVRVWLTLDGDAYREIAAYAKEAGMKVTQFLNMVSLMGARQFARTASPERFLTPEMWAQILKSAQAEGIEIQAPLPVKVAKTKAVKTKAVKGD